MNVSSNKQCLFSVFIPTVEVLGNLSSAKALLNPSVAEMFILIMCTNVERVQR